MRKYLTISVTDVTGSKHYQVHKAVKYLMQGSLVAAVGGAVMAIGVMVNQGDLLPAQQSIQPDQPPHMLTSLMRENEHLIRRFNEKMREFDDISQQVMAIEEMIGVEVIEGNTLSQRILMAGQMFGDQDKALKEIGARVESLEGEIGLAAQVNQTLQERVHVASLTLSQKKMLLNNIPNGYPVPFEGINSPYAKRIHPTLKKKEWHRAVDLAADMNTPIHATADGVVEWAGFHKKSGYGNLILVRHNYGFKTAFGHLAEVSVKNGEFVRRGDILGRTGNSGLSSGPHLHYEVRFNHRRLDPAPFMEWGMDNYDVVFNKEKWIKWPSLLQLVNRRLTDQTPPSLQLAQK
ncbi:MAG: M23 family metallopeptidase [Magnetococcales bacterium]|nr:M23 family metallopeptidase [Magnetococcales bacterium]